YGVTTFNHDLSGYGVAQNPNVAPVIFSGTQVGAGYSNWFNRAVTSTNTVTGQTFLVNSDTTSLGFRSRACIIALRLTLHFEFDRYRIGGGYSVEFMKICDFKPTNYSDDIRSFEPEDPSVMLQKYFVMLGGAVYRYYDYVLVVDFNFGGYNPGSSFDKSVIKKGLYMNFGAQ